MKIKFRYDKESILPGPSKETLKNFEEYWGVTLPKDYLDFIHEYNGLILEDGSFLVSNNQQISINEFCSILDDCYLNDPKIGFRAHHEISVIDSGKFMFFTDNKNKDELGYDVIPIAIVYNTCYICFDCRQDKDNPSLCFYDIELVEDEEDINLENLLNPVADTFSDFLNMIKN